jgi:hypothetical protein
LLCRCPSREDFPLIETEDKAYLRRIKSKFPSREWVDLHHILAKYRAALRKMRGAEEVAHLLFVPNFNQVESAGFSFGRLRCDSQHQLGDSQLSVTPV